MSIVIRHVLQQHGSAVKSAGTRLAFLQSRPASHWKCVAHYEAQLSKLQRLASAVPKRLLSVVKKKGDVTE